MLLSVFLDFHMFSYVFSWFPLFFYIFHCFLLFFCFPLFFYVSPCFSLFSYDFLCFPMFSPVFSCFPMILLVFFCFAMFFSVFLCFLLFSYDSPCFHRFFFSQLTPFCLCFLTGLSFFRSDFVHDTSVKRRFVISETAISPGWCDSHLLTKRNAFIGQQVNDVIIYCQHFWFE